MNSETNHHVVLPVRMLRFGLMALAALLLCLPAQAAFTVIQTDNQLKKIKAFKEKSLGSKWRFIDKNNTKQENGYTNALYEIVTHSLAPALRMATQNNIIADALGEYATPKGCRYKEMFANEDIYYMLHQDPRHKNWQAATGSFESSSPGKYIYRIYTNINLLADSKRIKTYQLFHRNIQGSFIHETGHLFLMVNYHGLNSQTAKQWEGTRLHNVWYAVHECFATYAKWQYFKEVDSPDVSLQDLIKDSLAYVEQTSNVDIKYYISLDYMYVFLRCLQATEENGKIAYKPDRYLLEAVNAVLQGGEIDSLYAQKIQDLALDPLISSEDSLDTKTGAAKYAYAKSFLDGLENDEKLRQIKLPTYETQNASELEWKREPLSAFPLTQHGIIPLFEKDNTPSFNGIASDEKGITIGNEKHPFAYNISLERYFPKAQWGKALQGLAVKPHPATCPTSEKWLKYSKAAMTVDNYNRIYFYRLISLLQQHRAQHVYLIKD